MNGITTARKSGEHVRAVYRVQVFAGFSGLVILAKFASTAWGTALESTVLGLPHFTWSSTFLQFKATFVTPSRYCIVINYVFTFHTTNVFGGFRGIMAQFEILEHKFNYANFKSHTEWSNVPTTTILQTSAVTHHDFELLRSRANSAN